MTDKELQPQQNNIVRVSQEQQVAMPSTATASPQNYPCAGLTWEGTETSPARCSVCSDVEKKIDELEKKYLDAVFSKWDPLGMLSGKHNEIMSYIQKLRFDMVAIITLVSWK